MAATHGGSSNGGGFGGGGDNSGGGDDDDGGRVYRAVAAGASADEVRRAIELCAQGSTERRLQAVNQPAGASNETPLQAAHRQHRGDLVGALVEAGADVDGIFGDGKLSPLAVCIMYGQVDSVRALLRAGHDANEKFEWDLYGYGSHRRDKQFCTAAHFCLKPPSVFHFPAVYIYPAQVGCLEVLLKDGGADANAVDSCGATPITVVVQPGGYKRDKEREVAAARLLVAAGARVSRVFDDEGRTLLMTAAAGNNIPLARFLLEEAGAPVNECARMYGRTALYICCEEAAWDERASEMAALLLDAGADVDARTEYGRTALFNVLWHGKRLALARLLLDRGASVDVIDADGRTPLLEACGIEDHCSLLVDECWPVFEEILRRSSAETRRSVLRANAGPLSAIDLLLNELGELWGLQVGEAEELRIKTRIEWMIAELLAAGVTVLPKSAPWQAAVVLPIAAAVSTRQEAELAARPAELCTSWRAHEAYVGVALDFGELRAAERAVAERRARVAALERELAEFGAGAGDSDGDSEDESGSDSDSDSEEDGEDESCEEGGTDSSSSSSSSDDEDESSASESASESASDDDKEAAAGVGVNGADSLN